MTRVAKNLSLMRIILLCRKAEDAEDVASQTDRAKDDHENPDNPEPDKGEGQIQMQIINCTVLLKKYETPICR